MALPTGSSSPTTDNGNVNDNDNGRSSGNVNDAKIKAAEDDLSPVEKTFTSLIQQNLALLLHDNATFLAERMVAYRSPSSSSSSSSPSSSSSSPYANYLLAMCHYRSHAPKRARSILLPFSNYNGSMGSCIMYLLAKCCIDLRLYNEAEEYLLKQAREEYAAYRKAAKKENHEANANANATSTNHNGTNNANVNTNTNQQQQKSIMNIEEWLGSVDPNECPVPNGAAGFHLLGIVCSRTMRREKAAKYLRLSLKLDPMMWASYEMLCEMGAVNGYGNGNGNGNLDDSDENEKHTTQTREDGNRSIHNNNIIHANDPSVIFGAIPKALMNIPISQGGYYYGPTATSSSSNALMTRGEETKVDPHDHDNARYLNHTAGNGNVNANVNASPFSLSNSPIVPDGDATMQMQMHEPNVNVSVSGVAGRLSFGAPSEIHRTPAGPGRMMTTTAADQSSELHGTSLFQNAGNISSIHGTSLRGGGVGGGVGREGGGIRGSLPSAALFTSPDGGIGGEMGMTPQHQHHRHQDDVLARAREVAGRRYYEPSPETTPPSRIRTMCVPHTSLKKTKRKYRRRLIDSCHNDTYDMMNITNVGMGMTEGDGIADGDGIGVGVGGRLFDSMEAPSPALRSVTEERKDLIKSVRKTSASTKKLPSVQENTVIASTISGNDGGEDEGVQYVLELLCTCGAAQRMLCSFKCKEALQILHTLPHSQFQTGWVQHQVGRAYFALVDYTNAQRALETMQQVEPHRMKGLELLSSTLWLLKKEVELSNLAQRVSDFDRTSPETWCVVGNCFSLQKEHKAALAFFRRSIQLDDTFTYAYTLSAYEYVANEDFDHAVTSFRNAIRVDERHHNAWNGLGEIYFRQEKYDLAEYHFQKGLSINPLNSVMRCNLGQAQHANGKHEVALETLRRVDKRNPQAQFQRANILVSMDKLIEALEELEKVRDAAPKEASVHFAIGRVLKRLKKPEEAMRAFLTALDLDPKENTLIKSAIDRLDEPDIDEDVSAF